MLLQLLSLQCAVMLEKKVAINPQQHPPPMLFSLLLQYCRGMCAAKLKEKMLSQELLIDLPEYINSRTLRVYTQYSKYTQSYKMTTYFEESLGCPGLTISFRSYKQKDTLHIRQYDEYGYPTRKGVCLSPENVRTLINDIIGPALSAMESKEEATFEITQEIRLRTNSYGNADIRLFWKPEDTFVPTKIGTPIKYKEFKQLVEILEERKEYFLVDDVVAE
jgi:hypothetical protein